MKLTPPFPKSSISQHFGQNANPLYSGQGLKGHTGTDYGVPFGTVIPSAADAYCYSRMHEDGGPGEYHGLFFLHEDDSGVYEISYGHLSGFVAEAGKTYKVGDPIGYVGNSGDVYSGDHKVTVEERLAGSHAGAHLHFQVRKLSKVKKFTKGSQRIYDQNGLLNIDSYYFEVPDYDNGYNGCVDAEQFFEDAPLPSNTSVTFDKAVEFLKQANMGQKLLDAINVLKGKYNV